jgi:anti-sigma factor RsiW
MACRAQWKLVRPTPVHRHFGEETAEKYSLGKLSARRTAEVEEHLLVCQTCQALVAEYDTYTAAMRKAAAMVRAAECKQKPKRRGAGK